MLWLIALLLTGPDRDAGHRDAGLRNAGETFRDTLEGGTWTDRGHSEIRYDFEHTSLPPTIRLYPSLGCALIFDRPYTDTWASDVEGASGRYYHYTPWGETVRGPTKLIIKNRIKPKEPVNLFFQFEDQVLEVLLLLVDEAEEADRLVRFHLKGFEEEQGLVLSDSPIASAPVSKWVSTPSGDDPPGIASFLMRPKLRRKSWRFGSVTYDFQNAPHFLAFEPAPHAPPLVALEVVRAEPKRWGKGFLMEYPFPENGRDSLGAATLLQFPNIALNPRERLYLRVQFQGERNAHFYKLRRQGWFASVFGRLRRAGPNTDQFGSQGFGRVEADSPVHDHFGSPAITGNDAAPTQGLEFTASRLVRDEARSPSQDLDSSSPARNATGINGIGSFLSEAGTLQVGQHAVPPPIAEVPPIWVT